MGTAGPNQDPLAWITMAFALLLLAGTVALVVAVIVDAVR